MKKSFVFLTLGLLLLLILPTQLFANGKCSPGPPEDFNSWWWQSVNYYNESLPQTAGVSRRFVLEHTAPVGTMIGPHPEGKIACTGTLIGNNYVLTAGHCTSQVVDPQNFLRMNFEEIDVNGKTTIRPISEYAILGAPISEKILNASLHGVNYYLDYAIVEVAENPNNPWDLEEMFGTEKILAVDIAPGERLTVVQHPQRQTAKGEPDYNGPLPKLVESGIETSIGPPEEALGLGILYGDLDMSGGSSGAAVLDDSGFVVGINAQGYCDVIGDGSNGKNGATMLEPLYHFDDRFRKFTSGWKLDDDVQDIAVKSDGSIYAIRNDDPLHPGHVFLYEGYDDANQRHDWTVVSSIPASRIYAGGDRLLMVGDRGNPAYVQAGVNPNWEYIGNGGEEFAMNTDGWVYRLSHNRQRISLWHGPGNGDAWNTLYSTNIGAVANIFTGDNAVYYSKLRADGDFALRKRESGNWVTVAKGQYSQFAVSKNDKVYALSVNGRRLYTFEGGVRDFIYSGEPLDAIYTDKSLVFARNEQSQEIHRYHSVAGYWKQITRPTHTFIAKGNAWLSIDGLTGDLNRYRRGYPGTGIPYIHANHNIQDSLPLGGSRTYRMHVEDGATFLKLDLNVDDQGVYEIYVGFEEVPSDESHTLKIVAAPNSRVLQQVHNPEAGDWYIRVVNRHLGGHFNFTTQVDDSTTGNCNGLPVWDSQTQYWQGDQVEYNGEVWEVIHTNADPGWPAPDDPAMWNIWTLIGSC